MRGQRQHHRRQVRNVRARCRTPRDGDHPSVRTNLRHDRIDRCQGMNPRRVSNQAIRIQAVGPLVPAHRQHVRLVRNRKIGLRRITRLFRQPVTSRLDQQRAARLLQGRDARIIHRILHKRIVEIRRETLIDDHRLMCRPLDQKRHRQPHAIQRHMAQQNRLHDMRPPGRNRHDRRAMQGRTLRRMGIRRALIHAPCVAVNGRHHLRRDQRVRDVETVIDHAHPHPGGGRLWVCRRRMPRPTRPRQQPGPRLIGLGQVEWQSARQRRRRHPIIPAPAEKRGKQRRPCRIHPQPSGLKRPQ